MDALLVCGYCATTRVFQRRPEDGKLCCTLCGTAKTTEETVEPDERLIGSFTD